MADHFDDGWDCSAALVDGRWVDRSPRRPQVVAALRRETVLLPWLGPQLPEPVPRPVVYAEDPLVVRHALIDGEPWDGTGVGVAAALGGFLRALHQVSATDARRVGVPELEPHWYDDFLERVLPLIDDDLQERGRALLDRAAQYPRSSLVHADLGPTHIRVAPGRLSGIIDWTDAGIGDPAIDLAWPLHGTSAQAAEAVARAYRLKRHERRRAADWHALGPWHQVTHGLDRDDEETWRDGLAGVCDRLRALPDRVPPLGVEPRLNRF